nr:alkaline phosphatase family protein [Actinoplanes digitatis]
MTDLLPPEAFEPVRLAYGVSSLADLMPSACALLGVPGTTDVLGLRAELEGVDRIAVLLVDGLGSYQLPVVAGYAPILGDLPGRDLTVGFPSTTPCSLVTLGTGAPPGAHGILGFTLRLPDGGILNHIQWGTDPDPAQWQPVPTCFERAAAAGVNVTQVTRPQFEGTGLSVAANRGARFVGAANPDELAAGMLAALNRPGLVYGYHPDLDHQGHAAGVDSPPWRTAAAEVGQLVSRLVDGLPAGAALLVTADHGQLNVPAEGRVDLDRDPALSAGIVAVSGEPRVRYLYVADGARDDVIAAWRGVLGPSAWVLAREEAVAEGWFGPVSPAHLDRIGEVVVICQGRAVVLASGREPAAVGRLVAYHGSVTAAEMTVPLLIAR